MLSLLKFKTKMLIVCDVTSSIVFLKEIALITFPSLQLDEISYFNIGFRNDQNT